MADAINHIHWILLSLALPGICWAEVDAVLNDHANGQRIDHLNTVWMPAGRRVGALVGDCEDVRLVATLRRRARTSLRDLEVDVRVDRYRNLGRVVAQRRLRNGATWVDNCLIQDGDVVAIRFGALREVGG